jgi:hypothetical protein
VGRLSIEARHHSHSAEALEWRRSQVLEYSSEGYSIREIAQKLQVGKSAIGRDIQFLRKQAQNNLQKHIHEVVPEEYQKCMIGMKRNLKQVLGIGEAASDPRVKLEARRIANDCYRYIMDLCTNVGVVGEALRYVSQKEEQINSLQKLDEKIEAIDDNETTNGVF